MRAHQHTVLPARIGVREVLALAWPVMVSMLSHTAMTVADTLFVGRMGTAPLAGVGMGAVASFVLTAAAFGLTNGVRVRVARATGAGRHDEARALAVQGLWIAALLGLLGPAVAPFSDRIVRLFGGSAEVAGFAGAFLRVILLGQLAPLASLALSGWFQGRGDTRTPMVAAVLANLLNILLAPALIFGAGPLPAFGVAGAAAANVIAQALGALGMVLVIRRHLRGVSPRPRVDLIRQALQVGLPMALRGVLAVGGFTVFVAILARAGDAHLGAHVIVLRIVSVSFLPGHAVGEATGVLVGQALGGHRPELAREAFRAGARLATGIMSAMALVFVLVPEPLVAVFHPQAEVVPIAIQLMLVGAAFQVFDALALVGQGALNGAGDTRFTLLAGVGSMWLVNLPLGWFLALDLGWGAPGAWAALTAEIIAYMVMVLWRLRGDAWLRQDHAEELPEPAAEPAVA